MDGMRANTVSYRFSRNNMNHLLHFYGKYGGGQNAINLRYSIFAHF